MSADPARAADVRRAGEWVLEHMNGVHGSALALRDLPGGRHPCVIGRIEASSRPEAAPTIAVYGHFDVQPPGDRAEWSSEPFAPEIRGASVYARGAADSKANCFIVLQAIKRLANRRSLPVNVDLLLDSEEEIDGTAIPDFVLERPPPKLAFVCDGAVLEDRTPRFCVSARGTLYYRLAVRTADRELHSGSYGGAALNAAGAITSCLSGVAATSLGTLPANLDPAPSTAVDGASALERAGAHPADAAAAEQFYERTVLRSVVDINSISSGDVGLQKTAIPPEAIADVSIRVGPDDDLRALDSEFRARLSAHIPAGTKLSVDCLASVPPARTPSDSPALLLAARAFERVFGNAPSLLGTGGTVAVFSAFAERDVPVVLSGFASEDGAAHAADEHLPLDNIPRGIEASCALLTSLADLGAG